MEEMAELNRVKERIRDLAGRRKNVRLAEIEWVVKQLGLCGYGVSSRTNGHQTLFRIGQTRFGVCHHNPGETQVKRCYVDHFLNVMIDLGLYDEQT
jgi:hypothetical protein